MKEAISELRSIIRHLRPRLLLRSEEDSTLTSSSTNQQQNDVSNNNNNISEVQIESVNELVTALSTFVWNLDCFWNDVINKEEEEIGVDDDNGDDGGMLDNDIQNDNDKRRNMTRKQQHVEPPETEYNTNVKLLLREGYGLLASISSSSSPSFSMALRDWASAVTQGISPFVRADDSNDSRA